MREVQPVADLPVASHVTRFAITVCREWIKGIVLIPRVFSYALVRRLGRSHRMRSDVTTESWCSRTSSRDDVTDKSPSMAR